MAEEAAVKPKHRGWPKGKPRGPRIRIAPTAEEPILDAPIHVKVWLKGEAEPVEFGAAERGRENGFHVFCYPSERDRYRTTRVEFAVSEVRRIEITEVAQRKVYDLRTEEGPVEIVAPRPAPAAPSRPVIHSAREDAKRRIQESLETSSGPIKLDSLAGLNFGDSAT